MINIFILPVVFFSSVIVSNLIVRFTSQKILNVSYPEFWPLREFSLRIPSQEEFLLLLIIFGLFYFSIKYLSKVSYKLSHVIFLGFCLLLFTNLLQGWHYGIVSPISGIGQQYYHDALKIKSAFGFLKDFNLIQPHLQIHSRLHPPGAVLTLYFLKNFLENPAFIAIFVAFVSLFFSGLFLYRIFKKELKDKQLSAFLTLLFILLPSVQVYYLASFDALIATFLLGVLYFFLHKNMRLSIAVTLFFLFLASFSTFLFFFILPVLLALEISKKQFPLKSILVIAGLILVYFIIYLASGFNYIYSFLQAAELENYAGLNLYFGKYNYIFSRAESLLEIIIFLGPFLTLLFLRAFAKLKKGSSTLYTASRAALTTFFVMLIFGFFRNGETSRVCLFLYPYLIFPIGVYLKDTLITAKEKEVLLSLVFSQALFMQFLGYYFW